MRCKERRLGAMRWCSVGLLLLVSACGKSSSTSSPSPVGNGDGTPASQGRVFVIKPTASATTDMVAAMVQALPGDVIEFDCGYFALASALLAGVLARFGIEAFAAARTALPLVLLGWWAARALEPQRRND